MSRQIVIVSNDNRSGRDSAADWIVPMDRIAQSGEVASVAFRSMTFVNHFTNITLYNNRFAFRWNGTVYMTEIAPGQYDQSNLFTALASVMVGAALLNPVQITGATVTRDALTHSVRINALHGATPPTGFSLLPADWITANPTFPITPIASNSSTGITPTGSINELLGASPLASGGEYVGGNTGGAFSVTLSNGALNLAGPMLVYLCCDGLGIDRTIRTGDMYPVNRLASVPLPNFGDSVTMSIPDTHLTWTPIRTARDLGYLRFYFQDRRGTPLSLPTNTPVIVEFELHNKGAQNFG